jgi:hypothetical protein
MSFGGKRNAAGAVDRNAHIEAVALQPAGKHVAIGFVVLHEEDTVAARLRGGCLRGGGSGGFRGAKHLTLILV